MSPARYTSCAMLLLSLRVVVYHRLYGGASPPFAHRFFKILSIDTNLRASPLSPRRTVVKLAPERGPDAARCTQHGLRS